MVISCEHHVQIVSNSRVGTATHRLKSNPTTRFLLLFHARHRYIRFFKMDVHFSKVAQTVGMEVVMHT